MKYKKIVTFFGIAAPIIILMRTYQVLFLIDEKGFALPRFRDFNYYILVALFAGAAATAVFGAFTHRCPLNPPKVKLPLGIASALMGVWTIVDMVIFSLPATIPQWQQVLTYILGTLSGLLWVAYAAQELIPQKMPSLLFVVPVLYWVIKLISAFTTLNTLALTTGHILQLLAICAILVFMLQLAKLMNNIDKEYNFKKLLASALCAVALCGTFSVPYLVALLFDNHAANVEGYSPILMLLVTGAFVLTFTLSYFSNNNLKKRKRHRHRTGILKINVEVDKFYTGD